MNRLQSSRFSHHRRKALSILAESGCGAQIRPINRAVERVPLRWRQLRSPRAQEILDCLLTDLARFTSGEAQSDDLTLIVISRNK